MADVKARFEFGWSSKSVKSLQHLLYQVNFEHYILQTLGLCYRELDAKI
jgi:hypothetical protein